MDTSPKIYDYVMAHLRAKRVPQRRVADGSGVPFSTLAKIAQGRIKDPSVHTIQALADYFRTDGSHTPAPDPVPRPESRGPREQAMEAAP